MASDSKKTKTDAAAKKDVAAKAESPAGKDAAKDAAKDAPKEPSKSEASKSEGGDKAPANYSRGEGQKPVTAAYRENWNVIFGDKSKKKKR